MVVPNPEKKKKKSRSYMNEEKERRRESMTPAVFKAFGRAGNSDGNNCP